MDDFGIIQGLLSILFGEEISSNFEIKQTQEFKDFIEIRLEELKELVPDELSKTEEVVLDGFCNPLELQNFPMNGKAVYLKLYRRRWKEKGSKKHFSNSYDFTEKGVKATREFSSFLKETFGQTPGEYNDHRNLLMY